MSTRMTKHGILMLTEKVNQHRSRSASLVYVPARREQSIRILFSDLDPQIGKSLFGFFAELPPLEAHAAYMALRSKAISIPRSAKLRESLQEDIGEAHTEESEQGGEDEADPEILPWDEEGLA